MATSIQEDSVGLVLRLSLLDGDGLAIPLQSNTTVQFIFSSPATIKTESPGYIYGDPTLGVVGYTTTTGNFSIKGTWRYQARVTFANGSIFFTEVKKIKVKANI